MIIAVSKTPNVEQYKTGEKFFSYADETIHAGTKNLNPAFIKKPSTVIINNIKAREAIFEWEAKQRSHERFTSGLIFFEPVKVGSDVIIVSVILKCKSEEYSILRSDVEAGLMSIELSK